MRVLVRAAVIAMTMMLAVGVGSVGAGGWAISVLDGFPTEFEAGETYTIGFTVLQHGQHPVDLSDAAIRVVSVETGEEHIFPAKPENSAGHHVAEVAFPASGEWSWEVSQGWFGPQSLGTVLVSEGAVAGGDGQSSGLLQAGQYFLPIVAIVLTLLFAVQLILVWRDRRPGLSAPEAEAAISPGD